MSRNVPEKELTEHRRRMLIHQLAIGTPKVKIARNLGVDRRTISRWTKADPAISQAVEDAQHEIYERAVEEFENLAFAATEVTAAVKLRALERIIDRHEENERQRSGQTTIADAQQILLHIVAVLDEPRFDEARMALIEAYETAMKEGEPAY